jgi:hypothetical protein
MKDSLQVIPLKRSLVFGIFKNSVLTSKRTPHCTITKVNRLTLFKEMIAVYSDNLTEKNSKYSVTDC